MRMKIVFLFIFLIGVSLTAQSDFEKVQNFKNKVDQLSNSIDAVDTPEALDSLQREVAALKENFADDKDLLDKSLYPENFNSTFEALESKIDTRRETFISVGMLEAKIVSLQNQLDDLNQENTKLLEQIKEYQRVGGKDKSSVNELRRLVSDLRTKLKQRDELVRSMVDSLLSDFVNHPMSLNDAEKQDMFEKVETGNLFYNVEKTVRDNLEFLKLSEFTPEQLSEVKEDQIQFYTMWKRIGPRLAKLYQEQEEQAADVAYINSMFVEWGQKVDERIWDRVSKVFRDNNIKLAAFSSGEELKSSLLTYIEEQSEKASEAEFEQFRDSVWIAEMRTNWLPVLIDNEMMTVEQKEELQTAIDKWEEKYDADTPYYWYALIGFIVLVLLLVFVPKWRQGNKPLSQQ